MEITDYVSYDLALKLKACGFDEPCDHYWSKAYKNSDRMAIRQASADDYNNDDWDVPHCSAPHIYHAQKWLREKGIAVSVQANEIQGELWYSADIITTKGINELVDGGFDYMDYEAALSAGITAALELIKKEE